PAAEAIAAAAALLASRSRPLAILGDGRRRSRGPAGAARAGGRRGAAGGGAITAGADPVLICGTYGPPEVLPALEGVFAPGAKVVHIDLDAYEIAKNFPVDLGLVADPKLTLGLLAAELERSLDP